MHFVRNKTNICSVYNFLRGNTALDTEEMKSGKKKTIAAADVFLAVKILKAEKPASCGKSDLGLLQIETATSTTVSLLEAVKDQPFGFCGRLGPACILSTGPTACT